MRDYNIVSTHLVVFQVPIQKYVMIVMQIMIQLPLNNASYTNIPLVTKKNTKEKGAGTTIWTPPPCIANNHLQPMGNGPPCPHTFG